MVWTKESDANQVNDPKRGLFSFQFNFCSFRRVFLLRRLHQFAPAETCAALHICAFECECEPRSNQNDKRSSHRLPGAHDGSQIPANFFLPKLYFRCFFVRVSVRIQCARARSFFFLIGVGQIEWNHPLNGIFRRNTIVCVRSNTTHRAIFVCMSSIKYCAFSFWRK